MIQVNSRRVASVALALLLLGACGGEESSPSSTPGDTLLSFKGSACKKEGTGGQALTADEAYAGLQCIRWKSLGADKLSIELFNFEGACGAQWKGQSQALADGVVELRAGNPGCLLAACGSCMYDWTFDVKVATSADLPLSIVTDPCPGEQQPHTVTATLPLTSAPDGELCRYADYSGLGWQAMSLGTCGHAYMPCRTSGGMCSPEGSSTEPCAVGLTCADGAGAGEPVCHAPCAGDGDCAPAGILTCQDGLCRPAKPW
ncbi:MAG: hypothetical protein KF718_03555 [Polyangiaceae bacterium]|nr:hypothetical protein [Polyangiaceae bacterium]